MVTVKELMTKDFLTIERGDTVAQLLGKLKKNNKRVALVFEGKKFLGVVRKIDLLRSKVPIEKEKVGGGMKWISA